MKAFVLAIFLLSSSAFASESGACKKQAVAAARAIFNINVQNQTSEYKAYPELTKQFTGENAYEVWDITFKGDVTYTPYRITVQNDGCIVSGFTMPFAG